VGYQCSTCGHWHEERPTSFRFPLPDVVAALDDNQRRRRVKSGPEQCILDDEHFFILGNLDLHVVGTNEIIRWTAWATRAELLAYRIYLAEEKAKAYDSPELLDDMKTSDPEALSLMTDDIETFMLRVRDRILRDHPDRVVLNHCQKCGGLAMTPKAQQCRWCHHDWHPRAQGSTG
jgi:Uncharacterized protein conserved in bacteria (DUF2199)